MSDESRLLRNIEKLGERYCKEILLKDWDKEKLEGDWWEALKFFFSHSFMRGRGDPLSNEYRYFTEDVLDEYFSITSGDRDKAYEKLKGSEEFFDKEPIKILKQRVRKGGTKGSIIKMHNFGTDVASKNPFVKILSTPKEVQVRWKGETNPKTVRLGNEEDIMMVLDVLKLISDERKANIYNYLKKSIQDDGATKTGEELKKIRAIAGKIASFIIRDIGLLNPKIIKTQEFKVAFPVDTWVKQISKKLGCKDEKTEDIIQYFIEKFDNFGISSLKFAAGLWYLGFNSLDLAVEYLGEVDIDSQRQSP